MKKYLLLLVTLIIASTFSNAKDIECLFTSTLWNTTDGKTSAYSDCSGVSKDKNWKIVNANNNNAGWDYIKMGKKGTNAAPVTVLGEIQRITPIPEEVLSASVNISTLNTSGSITTFELYISDDTEFDSSDIIIAGTNPTQAGSYSISIPNPQANKYYAIKIAVVNKSSTNGPVWIDKFTLTTKETAQEGPATPSASFPNSNYYANLGNEFSAPTLTTNSTGKITYTSSAPEVASVDGNTGAVTLLSVGTTIITGTVAAVPDQFTEKSASYTLTVTDPADVKYEDLDMTGATTCFNVTGSYGKIEHTSTTTKIKYQGRAMKSTDYMQINTTASSSGAGSGIISVENPLNLIIDKIIVTTDGSNTDKLFVDGCNQPGSLNSSSQIEAPKNSTPFKGNEVRHSSDNKTHTYVPATDYAYFYLHTTGSVKVASLSVYYRAAAPVVEKKVATPTIKLDAETNTVTLGCETEGNEIYYTIDGTAPTKASTKYTAPFTINESCTIKAIAYVGDDDSNVATYDAAVTPIYNDVAALYNLADGTEFKLTEPVTVIYDGGKHIIVAGMNRNIDLFNGKRTDATYAPGATFDKVEGSLSIYKGLYEISSYIVTEGVQGTAPEARETTITAINTATLKDILCNYVVLKNVTITGTTLKQDNATLTLYNQLGVADVPTSGTYDMIGVIGSYDGIQFWPISFTDVTEEPGKTKPEFKFEENEISIEVGYGEYDGVNLVCPDGLNVKYESDSDDVVIEEDGSFIYGITEPCDVVITASTEGNDEYLAASASYTIHFTAPKTLGALTVNGEVAVENNTYYYVIGKKVVLESENAEVMNITVMDEAADIVLNVEEYAGDHYEWVPDAVGTYTIEVTYEGCNDIDEVSFDVVITEPSKVVMGDVRAHFNFHGPAANVDGMATKNGKNFALKSNSTGDDNNNLHEVTLSFDIVTVSFDKNGGNIPRYWSHAINGTDGRIYDKNLMTIATSDGTPIKKITFYKAPATGTKWNLALDEDAAGTLDEDKLVWTPKDGESVSSVTFAPTGTSIFGGFKVEYYGVMPEAKVIGLTYGEPECEDTEDENVSIVKFNYTLHVDHHHADRADHYALKVVLTDSETNEEVGRGEFADHQQRVPFAAAPRRIASSKESDFDATHQFDGVVSIPVTGQHKISATVQYAANDGLYSEEEKLVFANPITTSIREVGVEADSSELWYDLSGRRVAAPGKGIFVKKFGNAVTKHMMR